MLHIEAKAHQIRHLQWRELKTAEHVIVKNSTYDECVIEGCKDMSYSKVAQGLAGLRPWVMARAPMWADD